jgi:HEAT repeat protein
MLCVWAARALLKVGSQREAALGTLVKALGDEDRSTRVAAALAVKELGPEARAAVPALRTLEDDPDPSVSKYATEALDEINRGGGQAEAGPESRPDPPTLR